MLCTSIEQSKRLIAAGISPDTADMCYLLIRPVNTDNYWHLGVGYFESDEDNTTVPAWSLGELWDLCKEKGYCLEFNTKEDTSEGMIEHMVNILADPIIGIMDKVANNEI